jgi:hypothetical protein
VASNTIGVEDMVFHSLFIGATGAGKTNALLDRLHSDEIATETVCTAPFGA